MHINSGIPNHAFFLVATALGGNAWEKAGPDLVPDHAGADEHERLRADGGDVDTKRRGALRAGSTEEKAVIKAWKAVGF